MIGRAPKNARRRRLPSNLAALSATLASDRRRGRRAATCRSFCSPNGSLGAPTRGGRSAAGAPWPAVPSRGALEGLNAGEPAAASAAACEPCEWATCPLARSPTSCARRAAASSRRSASSKRSVSTSRSAAQRACSSIVQRSPAGAGLRSKACSPRPARLSNGSYRLRPRSWRSSQC